MKRYLLILLLTIPFLLQEMRAQDDSYVPDSDESESLIMDAYLPDYQLGFAVNLLYPGGFYRSFVDKMSVGFMFDFYARPTRNNKLMFGFEYKFLEFDKSKIAPNMVVGNSNKITVRPRINDFMGMTKYEIFSSTYVIPYIKAGAGLRYYNSFVSETNPSYSSDYLTYSETKNVGFLGQIGAGVSISVYAPILIELGVNYNKSSRMKYDFLPADKVTGVQGHPLDFYQMNKSTMDYLFFDFRIVYEFYD